MKKIERFRSFLTYTIDFEIQNFAHFDDFYSLKLFYGLVVGFGPKGKPG